jgi:hypothetical protein
MLQVSQYYIVPAYIYSCFMFICRLGTVLAPLCSSQLIRLKLLSIMNSVPPQITAAWTWIPFHYPDSGNSTASFSVMQFNIIFLFPHSPKWLTHHHLVPRSWKNRAKPLLPLWTRVACYRMEPYLTLPKRLDSRTISWHQSYLHFLAFSYMS